VRYKQRRAGVDGDEITFLQLIDKAFAQDQAAKEALLETAYYLGLGIANLTKGLSPEVVILAGDIARAWPLISGELRSTLAANTICSGLPLAPVFASTLGDDTRLMGALSLVLASKFASVVPA
jgi:predicted NBD/HSP70 family sugar kinase